MKVIHFRTSTCVVTILLDECHRWDSLHIFNVCVCVCLTDVFIEDYIPWLCEIDCPLIDSALNNLPPLSNPPSSHTSSIFCPCRWSSPVTSVVRVRGRRPFTEEGIINHIRQFKSVLLLGDVWRHVSCWSGCGESVALLMYAGWTAAALCSVPAGWQCLLFFFF